MSMQIYKIFNYNKNNIPARKNDLNFTVEVINKILGISLMIGQYRVFA